MSEPLKAMILAAGLGTRLRPITDTIPKALVPILGIPNIYILIKRLASLGVDEIFVNGHYLWDILKKSLDTIPFPHPRITVSIELPKIRGTAGGIGAIKKYLKGGDLLVLSCDIVTDFNIEGLIQFHKTTEAFATMGLLKPRKQGKTPVWCVNDDIVGFGENFARPRDGEAASFSVIHILSRQFVQELPENEAAEIIPFYNRFLSEGKSIKGFFDDPLWYDIGDPEQFLIVNRHLEDLLSIDKIPIRIPIVECLDILKTWKG